MEEKKAMPSLLSLAKKAQPKAQAEKDKDTHVIKGAGISEKLKRLRAVKQEMDELDAELKQLEGVLKPLIHDKFIEIYQEQKRKPDSFKVCGEEGGEFLISVQDKYLKVTPAKATQLEKHEGLLHNKRTYILQVLPHTEAAITEAIVELLPKLEKQEDRDNLLTVKDEQFVMQGAIDRVMQYNDPKLVYGLIQPILSLK